MSGAAGPRLRAFYPGEPRRARTPPRGRALARVSAPAVLMTAASLGLLIVAVPTLFRARRLYAAGARATSRAVLRLYGIDLVVHYPCAPPTGQIVYISNHTSSLDIFVLVALGLPRCRFFLSGFLRKIVPLGIIATVLGTFFTVPQSRPADRTRIFRRADRILRRTRESAYLSPEGQRVATGRIGAFNKGAFHLATSLRAPIVPFYIEIPPEVDPGLGFDARPGKVHVHFLAPIDTRDWRLEDLVANKEAVRAEMLRFEEKLRCS